MLAGHALEEAWRAKWAEVRQRSAAMVGPSLLEQLAALPDLDRDAIIGSLSLAEFRSLLAEPRFFARPKQLPPPDLLWRWWMHCTGRGTGKSWSAGHWLRYRVEEEGAQSIGLFGPTFEDIENTMLNDDDCGLFNIFPPGQEPRWLSKKDHTIEFHTGAIARCYSAEDPEVRGPNFDTAWIDEIIKFRRALLFFDNINRALRKTTRTGAPSRGVITTTPQVVEIIKRLLIRKNLVTVTGRTDENASNLDPGYIDDLAEGANDATQQREREGDMVADEGALWTHDDIEAGRVKRAPPIVRMLVSIDPAASLSADSDAAGIITGGLGDDGEIYIVEDNSGKIAPEEWGAVAIEQVHTYRAEGVLVEDNRIGYTAASTVRAAMKDKKGKLVAAALKIIEKHARGEKATRAGPVRALYRKGLVHHVGTLQHLEAEMVTWDPSRPGPSPNRIDAMVHLVTELAGLDSDDDGEPEDYASSRTRSSFGGKAGTTTDDDDDWNDDDD